LTDEHVAQADTKKGSVLIQPAIAERRAVQWIGHKRFREQRNAVVQTIRGIFSQCDHVVADQRSLCFAGVSGTISARFNIAVSPLP
jgi:hypothetical protein